MFLSFAAVVLATAFWVHFLLLATRFIQKVRPLDRLFLVTSIFFFSLAITVIVKYLPS